ncbi:hypothetical protein BRARA_G02081 [Brassica rapa]|uniref:Aldehyde dehydrogenase domain-containing protein n=1 Tax=Brassica campestris TaxID=3711 RepID=A0A397YPX4_BRACM|nr:hypothetical protein BRARA_G02081 [Brassica rapa]
MRVFDVFAFQLRCSRGINYVHMTLNYVPSLREEIFKPVALLIRVKNQVGRCQNHYCRTCCLYIHKSSVQRSWYFSEVLEYVLVRVNKRLKSKEGVKQTDLGREGSKYGMDEYL